MSHNLLKAGAQRRRSKLEIQQAKLAEQERLRDIAIKVERFDQMQQELEELQRRQEEHQQAETAITNLGQMGLLKMDANGNFAGVESWEEHQRLLQSRQDDQQLSQRL